MADILQKAFRINFLQRQYSYVDSDFIEIVPSGKFSHGPE